MKFCISAIHLGRYKIEMLDNNNQVVTGTDGGSALVMLMLTKWLFEPEHRQYQHDQRTNSNAFGKATIKDMEDKPEKYLGQANPRSHRRAAPYPPFAIKHEK